jgi:LacI family transcriptional regulator
MRDQFIAVFATNDLTAIGLLAGLTEHGARLSHDVSVIGFNGIHLALYTSLKLTAVAQPLFQLGQRAAELLFDRLADGGTAQDLVILDTTLVVRGSRSPPRGEPAPQMPAVPGARTRRKEPHV